VVRPLLTTLLGGRPGNSDVTVTAVAARQSTKAQESVAVSRGLLRVTSVALCNRRRLADFRCAPFATEVEWRCNMSRRANSRHNREAIVYCSQTPSKVCRCNW
jgi:hypothetical protein